MFLSSFSLNVSAYSRFPMDSRDDDPTFTMDFSEDYLRMGGGFCVDEDEKDDPAKAGTIYENSNPEVELNTDPCSSSVRSKNRNRKY